MEKCDLLNCIFNVSGYCGFTLSDDEIDRLCNKDN